MKFGAQTDALNWVYDSLKATGIRLGHTFASKLYADEAITNFDIEVQFMNSEDPKSKLPFQEPHLQVRFGPTIQITTKRNGISLAGHVR